MTGHLFDDLDWDTAHECKRDPRDTARVRTPNAGPSFAAWMRDLKVRFGES